MCCFYKSKLFSSLSSGCVKGQRGKFIHQAQWCFADICKQPLWHFCGSGFPGTAGILLLLARSNMGHWPTSHFQAPLKLFWVPWSRTLPVVPDFREILICLLSVPWQNTSNHLSVCLLCLVPGAVAAKGLWGFSCQEQTESRHIPGELTLPLSWCTGNKVLLFAFEYHVKYWAWWCLGHISLLPSVQGCSGYSECLDHG